MKIKEGLYTVIGGIIGGILVMAVGSFSSLGAQEEAIDLKAGGLLEDG